MRTLFCLKKWCLALSILPILLLLSNVSEAQRQPFSRQDSALWLKHEAAYEKYSGQNQPKAASGYLNKIALLHWEHNDYASAISYYEKSLLLNEKLGNENGIAMISNNLGMLYADLKSYKKSLQYFYRTLAARKSKQEKIGTISALVNMSVVFNNLSKHDSAIVSLQKALSLARETNDLKQMRSCYGMLSETYEKTGDTQKSYEYFNLYRSFHEKLQQEKEQAYRKTTEAAKLRARLAEVEKKNKEYELLRKEEELKEKTAEIKHKEDKIKQVEDENTELFASLSEREIRLKLVEQNIEIQKIRLQDEKIRAKSARNMRNFLLLGILLVIIISGLIYRNSRQRKKNNKALQQKNAEIEAQSDNLKSAYNEIERKNRNITKSINYAGRIQAAMLNRSAELQEILPHSFVFFRPKDLVSGDFYWHEKIKDKIIIAAIDCTGHGVPGAFMSILGANLMDQIVINEKETNPARILQKLHEGVSQSLHQTHSENKDGMDAAICAVDLAEKKLAFAGAKNPLVYVQNETIHKINANRDAIGGAFDWSKKITFVLNAEIALDSKTNFYIFSDGFADQFGGPENRKYSSKRLRNTLLQNTSLDFKSQGEKLKKSFLDWKGNYDQTDDVLVIGFTIEQ